MYIDIWDGVKRKKSNKLFLCDVFYKCTWFLEIIKSKKWFFLFNYIFKGIKVKSDKKNELKLVFAYTEHLK